MHIRTGKDAAAATRLPGRRRFLGAAGVAAAAGLVGPGAAHAGPPPQPTPGASGSTGQADQPDKPGTVLAIGAHYDDCPFGIPGVLLQAAAKGHRVVILSIIGDYTNWKPVRGRGPAVVEGTTKICADYGAEARFLPYASGKVPVTDESIRAVAEVVAELKPDVAFMLWGADQHPDHEAAAKISKAALRLGDRVLADPFAPFSPPRRIYQFDNGPRHTIGFVPNTFVDITAEWPRSVEWLGRLMTLVRDEPYDPSAAPDGAQRLRETLTRYRGATCGVAHAEAMASADAYPQVLF